MKFEDKFKPGDIICSDRFHNGLCMIVEEGSLSRMWRDEPEFRYKCVDLIKENQGWCAYEFDSYLFNKPYDWRIATDDDVVKYLARYVRVNLGKVGEHFVAEYREDGIMLEDTMFTDKYIYLEIDELADLKRIIEERVG
jgi:hypothetical protein